MDSVWVHHITGNILILTHDEDYGWIWEDDEGFFIDCDDFYRVYEKLGDL